MPLVFSVFSCILYRLMIFFMTRIKKIPLSCRALSNFGFFNFPFLFFSFLRGISNFGPYLRPHMIKSCSRLNFCQSPPGSQKSLGVWVFTSFFTFVRSVLFLYPWIPIARPTPSHAVPQQSTTTRLHTTTSHVNSRMLSSVPRMICVSAETPREDSDRSECVLHTADKKLQLREQQTLLKTSRNSTKSLMRV